MQNKQLGKETLIEASSYSGKLLAGIDYIADNFMTGKDDLALASFADLVDGIIWLIDVVHLTQPLLDEAGVQFDNVEEIQKKMIEMKEAFENRDYVLLGDLLNYELKPLVEEWNEKLATVESRI